MTHNLINLDDDGVPPKGTTNGLIGKMTPTDKRTAPPHHDSFSELTGLMRAKKLYTPIPTPAPRTHPLTVASNGPRSFSRIQPSSSILSPLAKSFQAPESVASFLQEQELAAAEPSSEPISEYRVEKLRTLETITQEIISYNSEDDSEFDHGGCQRSPSPPYREPPLITGLKLPAGVGPTQPPTPTESLQNSPAGFRSDQEAVVRVSKQTWEALRKELNNIKKQKLELESQISTLETSNAILRDVDHDIDARLGRLKYQNEVNKDQKAAMGRSLSEKKTKIKTQQLEIDELIRQLGTMKGGFKDSNLNTGSGDLNYLCSMKLERALVDLAAKDREVEDLKQAFKKQECVIERVTSERDEAYRAQANSNDYLNRARNLADTLAQREKLITDLRHQLVAEKLKVTELEDDIESKKAKYNQTDIDDLKSKLREKTSVCDRQRNQLKITEAHLNQSQSRLMKITNHGESLHGAAHVVKPAETSKLPKLVISCVECFNKNLPCDNGAKCRNCIENNTLCARWRCSLKHKYGDCPLTPCPLSHDSQGWLVLRQERPEW